MQINILLNIFFKIDLVAGEMAARKAARLVFKGMQLNDLIGSDHDPVAGM